MTPSETNADADTPVRSSINVPPDLIVGLLGAGDENLRALERVLAADIHARGNALTLTGEPADVALAERVISELIAIAASGQPLTPEVVRHSVAMLTGTEGESPAEVLTLDILSRRGKTIRPKTLNQKRYVDAIDAHTIVFGIGPAGTGKTYLAMAKAVRALQTKQVSRIILTRPAVEAGERLGFLPGTLSEKIDPYLRPLYDALHDMMDPELIPKLMSAGIIEVAPLAYMRGRAQPLFTKVLTPSGFQAIGDLKVGDCVIGSDGRPTKVVGIYPQGFKEIYRVHTQDGSSTLATGDHLWAVHTRGDKWRGKPARVLADQGDDRQPAGGALSPLRAALAECAGTFRITASAVGSLRARITTWRRLHLEPNLTQLRNQRPRTGRGLGGADPGNHSPKEVRVLTTL